MSGPRFPHLPSESWDLFLRDELEGDAADRIERHLSECTACRAALEAEDPVFIFRRLRDQPAPAGTWDGFWEAVEPQLGTSRRTRAPFVLGLASVAATLVLGLFVVFAARGPRSGNDAAGDLGADATTGVVAVDRCPASVASLRLTREECLALFGEPIDGAEPPLIVLSDSVDLRGL